MTVLVCTCVFSQLASCFVPDSRRSASAKGLLGPDGYSEGEGAAATPVCFTASSYRVCVVPAFPAYPAVAAPGSVLAGVLRLYRSMVGHYFYRACCHGLSLRGWMGGSLDGMSHLPSFRMLQLVLTCALSVCSPIASSWIPKSEAQPPPC